jgi:hypothetical protein
MNAKVPRIVPLQPRGESQGEKKAATGEVTAFPLRESCYRPLLILFFLTALP